MITSKQRAYLRALANPLSAIFQVGKGGVSDELCTQLLHALEARELVKVSVLESCPYTAKEAANIIAEEIEADVVSVTGFKFVLYKESSEKKRIELP